MLAQRFCLINEQTLFLRGPLRRLFFARSIALALKDGQGRVLREPSIYFRQPAEVEAASTRIFDDA
jgi:hypothetical protein